MKEEKEILEEIYNVCNEIFQKYDECFYSPEEVKELKKDDKNKFL